MTGHRALDLPGVGGPQQQGRIAAAARRAIGDPRDPWSVAVVGLGSTREHLRQELGLEGLYAADSAAASPWRRISEAVWWTLVGGASALALTSAVLVLPGRHRREPDLDLFLDLAPSLLVIAAVLQLLATLWVPLVRRLVDGARLLAGIGTVLLLAAGARLWIVGEDVAARGGQDEVLVWALAGAAHALGAGLLIRRARPTPRSRQLHRVLLTHQRARSLEARIPRRTDPALERRWAAELDALDEDRDTGAWNERPSWDPTAGCWPAPSPRT